MLYELLHANLYRGSREVRKEGKLSIRVFDIGEHNAITLNSIFFRNAIVFLSPQIDESILRHEEGHTRQFNYIYAFLIVVGALLPLSPLTSIPAVILGKLILWKMERDADLYAYYNYNIMYNLQVERPRSRLKRLMAWLLDSHPPDYIRSSKEYYDKKTNIVKLFISDLLAS